MVVLFVDWIKYFLSAEPLVTGGLRFSHDRYRQVVVRIVDTPPTTQAGRAGL